MFEQAVLGIVQGVAEWLPVSSEGLIVLIKTNLFAHQDAFVLTIRQALFLHLGTFLAALIYFWRDVCHIIRGLLHYRSQTEETKNLIRFLFWATLISGIIGIFLINLVSHMASTLGTTRFAITLCIGLLLLVTGYLELKAKHGGYKELGDLRILDAIILGIVQGFAALPGLSRSGLTISALLLRKFDKELTLKLSFLMSLPIVLGGNIILNRDVWQWPPETYTGIFFSFLCGLLTIHLLLKLAHKINFGFFILVFAGLTLLSLFIK